MTDVPKYNEGEILDYHNEVARIEKSYTFSNSVFSGDDTRGQFQSKIREYILLSASADYHFRPLKLPGGTTKETIFKIAYDAITNAADKFEIAKYKIQSSTISERLERIVIYANSDLISKNSNIVFVMELEYDSEENEDWRNSSDDPMSGVSFGDKSSDINVMFLDVVSYGHHELVNYITNDFIQKHAEIRSTAKESLVNWIFVNGNSASSKTFKIEKTWDIKKSFYPWLGVDVKTYYQQFLDSKAQILVLYGPPGTGKTSFIRDFLCETGTNSFISYDSKILSSDSTFVNYVTNSIYNAIIIEDADDLLTSNRDDNNKIIAKILNVSDGLIKLPRKKLIFSTNLDNVDKIDPAIIRPGRCFDAMGFRELTKDEAQKVADDLDIKLIGDKSKYSLSEIFHMKDIIDSKDPLAVKHGDQLKKKAIGFV